MNRDCQTFIQVILSWLSRTWGAFDFSCNQKGDFLPNHGSHTTPYKLKIHFPISLNILTQKYPYWHLFPVYTWPYFDALSIQLTFNSKYYQRKQFDQSIKCKFFKCIWIFTCYCIIFFAFCGLVVWCYRSFSSLKYWQFWLLWTIELIVFVKLQCCIFLFCKNMFIVCVFNLSFVILRRIVNLIKSW